MDMKRRKKLLEQWKNRHPEMGVISICCTATGGLFFGMTNDTRAAFNGSRFKLSTGNHPNRPLQELWNQYGEEAFEFSVLRVLKYDNPQDDQTDKLTELLDQCLAETPQAERL